MKRFVIILFTALLCVTEMVAQKHHHFNPAQFQAELEQFITSEAGLTPKEAAAFFPYKVSLHSSFLILYFLFSPSFRFPLNSCLWNLSSALIMRKTFDAGSIFKKR